MQASLAVLVALTLVPVASWAQGGSSIESYDLGVWTKKSSVAQTLSNTEVTTSSEKTVYVMENFVDKDGTAHSLNGRLALAKVDAAADKYGWTKLEGYSTSNTITDDLCTCGLQLNGKNALVSILNLKKGDVVTIIHSQDQTAETVDDGLYIMSANATYNQNGTPTAVSGATKTAGNALVSGTEYTMTADGTFDFQFSKGFTYYIRKITIMKAAGSNPSDPGTEPGTDPDPEPGTGVVWTNNARMLWGTVNARSDASAGAYKSYNNVILLSWRMLQEDHAETAFDLYRSTQGSVETKLNATPIKGKTNWQDKTADRTKTNTYRLTMSGSSETVGLYTIKAEQASEGLPYIQVNLKGTKEVCPLDTIWYEANDVSVGDLDGDRVPDLVVKRLLTHGKTDRSIIYEGTAAVESPRHVRHTVLYEAYKLDGTFMWRICSGPNIMLGNSSSFAIADYDGDGRCEMAIKTGEGTVFGDGQEIGDTDGDGITDYREEGKHYIGLGPEFFSVVDGTTGRELARANYIPRGKSEDWGDDYYKRASSLRVAVANFSGANPSVLICRGVYERSVLEAWDYANGRLTRRWLFDSHAEGTGKDGKPNLKYASQGFHSLSVGDVDDDGYDEVVYGSMTVDHDGIGLYTSEYGHGDALHLGKFDPNRDGLQIWSCQEFGKTEAVLRDAATGATIWASVATDDNDTGRAMIADIDPNSPGCEMWWYQSNAHSISGEDLGYKPTSCNMAIWFGSGLNRQLLNETSIHQQYDNTRIFTIYRYDVSHINGTKGNPSWYGDLVGDWREEVIMPDATRTKNLKVFSTWYPTNYMLPWLMTDHVYEMSALNQNVGYNMPTQVGYYIGSDMETDHQTGIQEHRAISSSDKWFTLQGISVRVPQKGIYIKNGRKVIVGNKK